MTEKSKMTFATIAGLCLAVMIGLGAGWMAEHHPIFKREPAVAEEPAPRKWTVEPFTEVCGPWHWDEEHQRGWQICAGHGPQGDTMKMRMIY